MRKGANNVNPTSLVIADASRFLRMFRALVPVVKFERDARRFRGTIIFEARGGG